MESNINWALFKTGGTLEGILDLVIGECCIARVVPVHRFSTTLYAIRSLEYNMHNKLFGSPAEAAEAMVQLIDWKDDDDAKTND